MARVQDLATLLSGPKHHSLRSLRLKGLIQDIDIPRIAFVFEAHIGGYQTPKPLRSMFAGSPSVTKVTAASSADCRERKAFPYGWVAAQESAIREHPFLLTELLKLFFAQSDPGRLCFLMPGFAI